MINPRVLFLSDIDEVKEEIRKTGCDASAIGIMVQKGVFRILKLENIPSKAAVIIKQEMLSKGGEAAINRGVVNRSVDKTDVLLMGTKRHYEGLIYKLKMQPFGLREVADEIEKTLINVDNRPSGLKAGKHYLPFGQRTYIMGILNVTPDSFSDGGMYNSIDKAIERAKEMTTEGADIIDVGGESTRPGAEPVPLEEELRRVIPVLERLVKEVDVPISIDTYKAEVARRALEVGVHIINDVWGLKKDPNMAEVVAEYDVPIIVMHNKENNTYTDLMAEIISSLRESIQIGEKAGIRPENIIIDPGIGFAKDTEQSLRVMRNMKQLKSLGKPILLGTSRKSMIGNTLNLPVTERIEGTAATVALSIVQGVDIVRVHDVKEMTRVVRMTDAIARK